MKQSEYIPGVCNIGKSEINKRLRVGSLGLLLTLFLGFILIFSKANIFARLFIFIPAFISSIGFIQAKMKFCAYFGFSSLFNFGETNNTENVLVQEARKLDQAKAWKIVIYSFLLALAITMFFVIL